MKKAFVFCCLYWIIGSIYAQQASPSHFGLKAGWTQAFIGDQHTSPLLYHANMMNIGAIYQRQGPFFLEVALTVKIGNNQAQRFGKRTFNYENTPDIYGEIEIDEIPANPFLSILAGAFHVKTLWALNDQHQFGVSLNAKHIYTGMSLDDWHYTQLDLAPEYQFSYRLFDGDIQASLSLPILAGVVRPNYAFDPSLQDLTSYYRGYVRTGSDIVSLNKLINPRFRSRIYLAF